MNVSKAVLITGCSSGIGWATAERLVDVGWRVYATARSVEKMAPLEQRGCELLPLDVTDEDSMRSAVDEVERRDGPVGVLVNNADLVKHIIENEMLNGEVIRLDGAIRMAPS
jgi:NAD(P)-dependent dehydrogenase (short-subunit alcohol dehydrogenase family)